ncbi:hypothetical protein QE429_003190 [Bacillus sp. SORGH_AS 510]|nr:hypothetical protein [Bacillus sp. SORGH_AS_0510]
MVGKITIMNCYGEVVARVNLVKYVEEEAKKETE